MRLGLKLTLPTLLHEYIITYPCLLIVSFVSFIYVYNTFTVTLNVKMINFEIKQ